MGTSRFFVLLQIVVALGISLTQLTVPMWDSCHVRCPHMILPLSVAWTCALVLDLWPGLESVCFALSVCFAMAIQWILPLPLLLGGQTPNAFAEYKIIIIVVVSGTESLSLSSTEPWNKMFGSQMGEEQGNFTSIIKQWSSFKEDCMFLSIW